MKNIEKEKKLNLIIITDTHGEINTEILDIFADGISEEIDALVCLGDVTDSDLDKIKNHTSFKNVDRKFGILGNHDFWNVLDRQGFENISGKKIEVKGYSFVGMYGSNRYKEGNFPMFTDKESQQYVSKLPSCDIFITHDSSKKVADATIAHEGLLGINDYINNAMCKIHFHGHYHKNQKEIHNNGIHNVVSYGFYMLAHVTYNGEDIEIISTYHDAAKKFEKNKEKMSDVELKYLFKKYLKKI